MIRSLPADVPKCAGRAPLTVTLLTAMVSARSKVKFCNEASVTAVIVADPVSRLLETLYSRSSS